MDYDLIILGLSTAGIEAALWAAQHRSRVGLVTLNLDLGNRQLLATLLAQLETAGIDPIASEGYFLPNNRGFYSPQRAQPLTARASLLALPPAAIGGDVSDFVLKTGEHWLCLGGDPEILVSVQRLAKSDQRVTLLWPKADFFREPVWQRVQVYLEGLGVEIWTGVETMRPLEGSRSKKGIVLDTNLGQFEGDRLLQGTLPQPIAVELQLEQLHPDLTLTEPIAVNGFLQSKLAPRLYACGVSLGGFASDSIARYEARLAAANILYFPQRSVRYDTLPYVVLSDPLLTQLGWTERQATRHWSPSPVSVWESTGWTETDLDPFISPVLRVLIHRNGQILGAQGLGNQAAKAIEVLALAKQQCQSWPRLLQTLQGGEVAEHLRSLEWQQIQAQTAVGQYSWREPFFNWRRTGFF